MMGTLVNFRCYKCGKGIQAPKKSIVVCTCCHRQMWPEVEFKNEDLIREEMLLNFNSYIEYERQQ